MRGLMHRRSAVLHGHSKKLRLRALLLGARCSRADERAGGRAVLVAQLAAAVLHQCRAVLAAGVVVGFALGPQAALGLAAVLPVKRALALLIVEPDPPGALSHVL